MKVTIWYNIDSYADKFKRKSTQCEAFLEFRRSTRQGYETIVGRGKTFQEARKKVIELFKMLPPSETLDL